MEKPLAPVISSVVTPDDFCRDKQLYEALAVKPEPSRISYFCLFTCLDFRHEEKRSKVRTVHEPIPICTWNGFATESSLFPVVLPLGFAHHRSSAKHFTNQLSTNVGGPGPSSWRRGTPWLTLHSLLGGALAEPKPTRSSLIVLGRDFKDKFLSRLRLRRRCLGGAGRPAARPSLAHVFPSFSRDNNIVSG